MMRNLFLLACAATASLVGCCNDGCCKKCGGPATGQAQSAGQVPASPSTPALAGRMIQGNAQPTSAQVLSTQQITPQSPGMSSNSMTGRPMATESMAGKPASMDSLSR